MLLTGQDIDPEHNQYVSVAQMEDWNLSVKVSV